MRRNNKQITTYFILFSLLIIGVVYAILQANLQINGTAKIQANTWDIHFDNIQINENSVSIGTGDSAATIDPENNCKVDFEVTLSIPGDFYEFTIDVVNAGTIDGMIGELTKTLIVNNTPVDTPPDYLNYSVTYNDGDEILENHKLDAGATEIYKVRLEYKTDIEELAPASTISTSLTPQFIQADSTSVYRADADFATSSWDEIVKTYKIGNLTKLQQAMEDGTTKPVQLDMDFDGTFETTAHVRIANLSTPSECSTTGFSQTSCGFIIEFSDIISTHRMNPYENGNYSLNGSVIGTGNNGGWEYSDMRAYLNSSKYLEGYANEIDYTSTGIYNTLPASIKDIIINTIVVSGRGSYDYSNYVTNDKLFLLDGTEIFGTRFDNPFFTAKNQQRQIDYYSMLSTKTSSNFIASKKNLSGDNTNWWMRSAYSSVGSYFCAVTYNGFSHNDNSCEIKGVSPAFRIAE